MRLPYVPYSLCPKLVVSVVSTLSRYRQLIWDGGCTFCRFQLMKLGVLPLWLKTKNLDLGVYKNANMHYFSFIVCASFYIVRCGAISYFLSMFALCGVYVYCFHLLSALLCKVHTAHTVIDNFNSCATLGLSSLFLVSDNTRKSHGCSCLSKLTECFDPSFAWSSISYVPKY
jgi:hypothetical protein